MKPQPVSKPFFSSEDVAAALKAAPELAISDSDNLPTESADWQQAIISHSLTELHQQIQPKIQATVAFDADVLAALKASGKNWQKQVNETMRAWLQTQQPMQER